MVQPFSKLGIESLPEPLTNTRLCEKCQCSLTCSLLQKSSDDPISHLRTSKEMSEFVDLTTIHLSPTHLEYAKKWLKWSILEWETAKRKKKLNDIFMDAPEKREENGNCLANVRLIKCEEIGSQNLHLSFSKRSGNLPHGIFEKGEVVTVSTRTSYAILMGPIISYESQVVTIRVDKFNLRLNNFYHLDKYEGYSTYGLHLGNIVGLMDATPYSTKIRELVIDKRTPTFVTLAKEDVLKVGSIIKELEGNQARAVVKGLTCKDYLLIQGLPGSGKTTTIVALVRCLLRLGRSVLLTAYTNSAVDNMVIRLKKFISEDQILRVASNSVHPDIRPLTLESKIASLSSQRDVVFEETRRILEKTPVIATTCLMASSNSLFLWRRFDVCIVDEASLALQTAVIKPISLANSFVLVGDSRQLAPLVLNNAAKSQGMTVSLLEHLAESCVEGALISLNKQFRMNKQICGLSSTLFYENTLICANMEIENRVVEIGSQENVPFNLSNNG
uniref:DNA replication ATP-dependent helicase/nuclease n=1 Tax=Acrobeloides nanus TaxID=290746 RepID=A0A914CZG4_9BILA